jgi:hypothetical protein
MNVTTRQDAVLNAITSEFVRHASASVMDAPCAQRTQLNVGGLVFCIRARPIKQMLSSTVETDFECVLSDLPGAAELELWHAGALRRTGVTGRVKKGGAAAQAMLQAVLADGAFVAAALPLDFKRFVLVHDANGWRAEVSLMGGAWVNTSLPPSRRYVALGREQVQALVDSLRGLVKVFDYVRATS